MPAILTHDLFGRDAYDGVASVLGLRSEDERDAFLLGNQGPDPLFYLVVDPRKAKWEWLGEVMHSDCPARLLSVMHDSLGRLGGRELSFGRAYLAGFLCHYLLDRSAHPLVYAYQYGICDAGVEGLDRTHGSKVHAEIERDIDEMVLFAKTGCTVAEWRPAERALHASGEVLSAIDKVYFHLALWAFGRPVDADVFSSAVHGFRFAQRLFHSPGGVRRRVLSAVERAVSGTRYSLYSAMSHRSRAQRTSDFDNRDHVPWENPFTGAVTDASFWDLYDAAQAEVVPAVTEFLSEGFDEAAARALTHDLNFSGEPAPCDGGVPAT